MEVKYISTRNKNIKCSCKEAILKGIADDGGLYVYDRLDELELPLNDMMNMTYEQMAEIVLSLLLPDYCEDEIEQCVKNAYETKFESKNITPLHIVKDIPILELFHGPTCAFKDVGLQMLPQLMSKAIDNSYQQKVMILTATSGDTGKAALEGFKNVENIAITVFYPNNGVSNIQRLQMTTTDGFNTKVCAIHGNFDDAQTNVKKIFQNKKLKEQLMKKKIILSSANSINIGRLIPQVVYYIYAYKEMVQQHQITFGDEINFCVPTGNFGNVLAGYYAKCMGLPIKRLIVASNENNVLYDFLKNGEYNRNRIFYKTISPSMDILISSNLERLLYYKSGKDTDYICKLMNDLETKGSYKIKDELKYDIQKDFYGGYCTDKDCKAIIRNVYEEKGYILDPHTATGYKVMEEYQKEDSTPCVLLSTASPYKFASTVMEAIFNEKYTDEFTCMKQLSIKTNTVIPQSLVLLNKEKIVHKDVIDKNNMIKYVENTTKEIFHG